ncbi:MAG: hypothetical protein WC566_05705 [Dehalococcoidia bacterium]
MGRPQSHAELLEMPGRAEEARQLRAEQSADRERREAKKTIDAENNEIEWQEGKHPQDEKHDAKQDDDKPAEVKTPPKVNFILVRNKPYFQVDSGDGSYCFAHLVDGGIQFIDSVGDYKPQPLPVVNGKPLKLVLMPDVEVANAKLYTPGDLFESLKAHITSYVDLSPLDFELCIYYIIFTWFSPKVDTLGYLRLLGDTGKGKSRALKVIGDLTFYAIQSSGASTFSGIARTKEKFNGTLIIDEADIAGDASHTLIKYLNLGFERGKFFILSDKKNPRNQDIFDPFSPKVIAMRKPYEDNATEGRLLSIDMHETGNKHLPIILPETYEAETQRLRNELCCFGLHHWGNIDGHIMTDMTELNIEPRLKQLGMPLSIIFQLWPKGEARFIEYLSHRQQEIRLIRATSWDGTLINTVIQLARGEIDLPSEFDKFKLNGIPAAITPSMVAKIAGGSPKSASERLAGCGFKLELIRIKTDTEKARTTRAYLVPNVKAWNEIISRYYANGDEQAPEIPDNLRGRFFQNVTDVTDVTDKKTPPLPAGDPEQEKDCVLINHKSVTTVTSVTADGPSDEPPYDPADDITPEDSPWDDDMEQCLVRTPEVLLEHFDSLTNPAIQMADGINRDLRKLLASEYLPRFTPYINKWYFETGGK